LKIADVWRAKRAKIAKLKLKDCINETKLQIDAESISVLSVCSGVITQFKAVSHFLGQILLRLARNVNIDKTKFLFFVLIFK
jgi:hypothetical protein